MLVTLSLLSATLSTLLIFSSTPLAMTAVIVLQAIIVSFYLFAILSTSWFSFILFLIFTSAMMIIFVYVSSLASNDFLNSLISPLFIVFLVMLVMTLTLTIMAPTYMPTNFSQSMLTDLNLSPACVYKIYAPYLSTLTVFLIVYILIALIAVVKNSSVSSGPLRPLNY